MFVPSGEVTRQVLQLVRMRDWKVEGPRRVRSVCGEVRARSWWQVRRRWTREAKSRWVRIWRRSSSGRARRRRGRGSCCGGGRVWSRARDWDLGGVEGDSMVVVVAVVAAEVDEAVECLVADRGAVEVDCGAPVSSTVSGLELPTAGTSSFCVSAMISPASSPPALSRAFNVVDGRMVLSAGRNKKRQEVAHV
jgi:hypothetical protein